jgi:photosystem II stability/assembly factor-like uncharacterized protein
MKKLILSFTFITTISFTNAQWLKTNFNNRVNCFAVNGLNIFAGTLGYGVFLSTNNGTSWTDVNKGLDATKKSFVKSDTGWSTTTVGMSVMSLCTSGKNIFAGTIGGVFLSTDTCKSWTNVNNGLINNMGMSMCMSLAVNDSNIYVGTQEYGVFLSSDNGKSWTLASTNIRSSSFQDIPCLAIRNSNIFAGTNPDGIIFSSNNGRNWTYVNTGLSNLHILSLAIKGKNIFAGTAGGGVFLSTNDGVSWSAVNTGLKNDTVYALTIKDANVFAGTAAGVFLSSNNGKIWTAVNAGLINDAICALVVKDTYIFAGTRHNGVWYRPLAEMTRKK